MATNDLPDPRSSADRVKTLSAELKNLHITISRPRLDGTTAHVIASRVNVCEPEAFIGVGGLGARVNVLTDARGNTLELRFTGEGVRTASLPDINVELWEIRLAEHGRTRSCRYIKRSILMVRSSSPGFRRASIALQLYPTSSRAVLEEQARVGDSLRSSLTQSLCKKVIFTLC